MEDSSPPGFGKHKMSNVPELRGLRKRGSLIHHFRFSLLMEFFFTRLCTTRCSGNRMAESCSAPLNGPGSTQKSKPAVASFGSILTCPSTEALALWIQKLATQG